MVKDRPAEPAEAAVWAAAGAHADLSALGGSVGFMVRLVQLQSFQLFYRKFEQGGPSLGALSTLGAISANPGIRHGVLADALMIKRPNFTKVINRLEEDGLITREAPERDKRATALYPTRKGVRLLEERFATIRRYQETMVSALSPEEQETLLLLLRKLSKHLKKQLGPDSFEPADPA
jgi:DNA-binding MarR family transcriptional regulator